MNELESSCDINHIGRILPATRTENHERYSGPDPLSARPNKVMPDLTEQAFARILFLSEPFLNLLKFRSYEVVWRKGVRLAKACFGRHIQLI